MTEIELLAEKMMIEIGYISFWSPPPEVRQSYIERAKKALKEKK